MDLRRTMTEIWLRNNRRILLIALGFEAILIAIGLAVEAGLFADVPPIWIRIIGWSLPVAVAAAVLAMFLEARRPRLAFDGHDLLVNLRKGAPLKVPIEIVEGFLLGQGPAYLPGRKPDSAETTTLVVRLAERADEWRHLEVEPRLGSWCDGYITIRGTWCEPLTPDVARSLNSRLTKAKHRLEEGAE